MIVPAIVALLALSYFGVETDAFELNSESCGDFPSRRFNHSEVTDTWIEYGRTAALWEIGASCIKVDLFFDADDNMNMNITGKAAFNRPYHFEVEASKTEKTNEFETKILGSDLNLRFEIAKNLLILIGCTYLPGGFVGRDAWILVREGTTGYELDDAISAGQSALRAYGFDRLPIQDRTAC